MELIISDNPELTTTDSYRLTQEQFSTKAYHPFIATREWDAITVELSENTPRGIIRELLPLGAIRVRVTDSMMEDMPILLLQLLCEVFPDNVGELRMLYMKDKEVFKTKVMSIVSRS